MNTIDPVTRKVNWQRRHTIVVVCFFAMFISYIDRVNISVAALAMQQELGWTESKKGFVLSAFFFGYMLMQIIGGWLANIYGGKRVLLIALLLTSLCTLLTPLAAYLWLPVLIMMRVALGLSEAPINPSVYNIFSRIVPVAERTRSIALYSSAGFLGTFFALALTGWIVEQYGWEIPFYLMGLIGLVYVIFIHKLIDMQADDSALPAEDANIGGNKNIPWRRLIAQIPFWALVVTFFCTSWIFYMLLSWMPSYFANAYGLQVAKSGFYSMTPWLVMFFAMNLSGWISDSLIKHQWTTTATRKLMTSVGLFGAGALLILVRNAATPEQAMIYLSGALGFLALAYSSEAPNVIDIAPRYADVLFGILNTFGSLPGVIGVALTGILVQSTNSYEAAFAVAGGLAVFGGIVFLLLGTGRKLVD